MQLHRFHLPQRIPPADHNISNSKLGGRPPAVGLHLTAPNIPHSAAHMELPLYVDSEDHTFSILPNTICTAGTLQYRSVLDNAAD